jgi:hypothetical protein
LIYNLSYGTRRINVDPDMPKFCRSLIPTLKFLAIVRRASCLDPPLLLSYRNVKCKIYESIDVQCAKQELRVEAGGEGGGGVKEKPQAEIQLAAIIARRALLISGLLKHRWNCITKPVTHSSHNPSLSHHTILYRRHSYTTT